jgi:hypothetical protein
MAWSFGVLDAFNSKRDILESGLFSGGSHMTIKRPPTSAEQKAKLSEAQLAYIANDQRWAEHRRKLAAAQEAKRMTLTEEEVTLVKQLRNKGRSFSYIQEEIGVCHDVIRREIQAHGIPTGRIKPNRRARQGKGFWRSFD